MSINAVAQFVSAVGGDKSLQPKMQTVESVVKLGADKGYKFTADEFNTFIRKRESGELNDDQLRTMAGGNTSGLGQPVQVEFFLDRFGRKRGTVGGDYPDKP